MFYVWSFQSKYKSFEVSEYVLPKFEAKIEASDEITINDEKLRAVISAKYTYGKPLKGKAVVSVAERDYYGGAVFRVIDGKDVKQDDALCKKIIEIDGRGPIEFDLVKELSMEKKSSLGCSRYSYRGCEEYKEFEVSAEVIEDLTGLHYILFSLDRSILFPADLLKRMLINSDYSLRACLLHKEMREGLLFPV